MTCPIALERLFDAYARELSDADEQALEDHVFACDTCGEAYARLGRLVAGLRAFIPPVITRARLERLRESGTRVRLTEMGAGESATVRFGPDVDLVVHAFRGDLADAERVDVALESLDGAPIFAFDDVAFDRDKGEVLIACQRHYEALGPAEIRFRVRAHTADGARAVGDYVVDHLFG